MKLEAKTVLNNSGSPCFEVKYKDRPFKVKLFKFQESQPDGTVIDCIETKQANGEIFLRQNLAALLTQFYSPGGEYDFEVKYDFTHNGYYGLTDENGFQFKLYLPKNKRLLIGTSVKCLVKKIDQTGASVELSSSSLSQLLDPTAQGDDKSNFSADTIAQTVEEEVFSKELPQWDIEQLFEMLFINDEFYDREVSRRMLETIRTLRGDGCQWDRVCVCLSQMKEAVMYVLEESTVLLVESPSSRKSLQQRLAAIASNLNGYLRAARYLAQNTHEEKVDRVLKSLRTSGYIYEAEKQLDMLMRVFSLHADTMVSRMQEIFDIIHARPEDFWRDEPFRKAFIRLLQLFIEQSIQNLRGIGTASENEVKPLIEALSIQLLLADQTGDADVFDYNLNLATLYRYAAGRRTSVPANAVRNAFLALMDVSRRPSTMYSWNETGSHDLVASKLTVAPTGLEGNFEKWYANRQVVLRVDTDGVTLLRNDVDETELRTLELPEVGVWPILRIRSTQRIAPPRPNTTLKDARTMWGAIEKSLFTDEERNARTSAGVKVMPAAGDECFIRVTSQISDTTFEAEVTDEEYFGHGFISLADMVRYNVQNLGMQHFRNEHGEPYIFLAQVKEVKDNILHFTILDLVKEFSHETAGNDRQLRCVVKSINQYGIIGISELGDAVRFKSDGDGFDLKIGDQVTGSYWQVPDKPGVPYIDGVVTERLEAYPNSFNVAQAFSRLIADYSDGQTWSAPDAMDSSAEVADNADFLPDARMQMLMSTIEQQAASESDYMKAFNHIGFARLLARLTRDDKRREFYNSWMRLIDILHNFALNGLVDPAQLHDFELNDRSNFDPRSELFRRYTELKTVSYKGHLDKRDELWTLMSHHDEDIRGLAENVMAYNLIAENASMSALGEISDRINNILNVRGRQTTLHSFGAENKTTEFKTSLVFPPNNHMRADIEAQSKEIMKELCALLNADGGTLYMGVNDFGMGVGIENDLAFWMFNGSEDKYDLYFRRRVCDILGRDVDAYVDAEFRTYGQKRIYEVKVRPYLTSPVKVDGYIYERHGSSKLKFDDPADIRLFTERRAQERDRQRNQLQAETDAASARQSAAKKTTSPAAAPDDKKAGHDGDSHATPWYERITTRSSRPQCPASYDPEHDPATVCYLQLTKTGFLKVPEFYGYQPDDDNLLLTLPVREEDRRSWLVLGYADGSVARVPMRLALDKEDYVEGLRFTGTDVLFADILQEDEALLIVSGKGEKYYARAENPDRLEEAQNMRTPGKRLFNTDLDKYVYDVIPSLKRLNYPDLFERGYRDAGKPLRMMHNDPLTRQFARDGLAGCR